MDSEHRHELQENDLKEFLSHFNQWWNKHGTQTLLVILIIVSSVVGIRWYRGKDVREREAAWSDFAGTSSPEGLSEVAQRYSDRPGLAGFALLRAADLLAEQAVASDAPSAANAANTAPVAVKTEDERMRLLDRSTALAKQVVDEPQTTEPSLVKLNARMRMAANYETLGKWDLATAQYEAIRSEAGPFKTIAAQADLRLQNIATIKEPIVLPDAPPAPAPAPDATQAPVAPPAPAPGIAPESTPAPAQP